MEKINSLASFSQALKHAILKAKAYFALKYNNLYTWVIIEKKKSYTHMFKQHNSM